MHMQCATAGYHRTTTAVPGIAYSALFYTSRPMVLSYAEHFSGGFQTVTGREKDCAFTIFSRLYWGLLDFAGILYWPLRELASNVHRFRLSAAVHMRNTHWACNGWISSYAILVDYQHDQSSLRDRRS